MTNLKIAYLGNGLAGYYGIQRLKRGSLKDSVDISCVIVSHTAGNNAKMVSDIANTYGLPVYTTPFTKDLEDQIKSCDAGVVMNFDQKIPGAILGAPKQGFWNVHPAKLPEYRGGAPLEYIIAKGDELRITVHQMTSQFDSGDILYMSAPTKVWEMDINELYHFSSKQSALALEEGLQKLKTGDYTLQPQQGIVGSANARDLGKLLTINWNNDTGEEIYQKILAGGRKRGANTFVDIEGERKMLTIHDANYYPSLQKKVPGTVSIEGDGTYTIAVKDGTLYVSNIGECGHDIINTLNRANTTQVMLG